MDKLFTGNYDKDDENKNEKEEINELLKLLNGLQADEETIFEEEPFSSPFEVEEEYLEFEEDVQHEDKLEDDEYVFAEEGTANGNLQYIDVLEEFENLGKQKENKTDDKKEKKNLFSKIKGIFFKVVDEEEEEADENQRILKELEKANKKTEKKAQALRDKESKKAARKVKRAEKSSLLEKIKSAKKEKPPAIPEEKIRVTPVFIAFLFTIIAGFVLITILGSNTISYDRSYSNAKDYFFAERYELAYKEIAGLEPREKDETIHRQILLVMAIEKQYISYLNYKDMGMEAEALNALVMGIAKYDNQMLKASELGVIKDIDLVLTKISDALAEDFGISQGDARSLNLLSDPTEYSQQIYTLLGY